MKEKIIKYLIDTYNPEAIITYGSYSNGTANEHSDFDAMIIAESEAVHDESVVEGVVLDVFIYSPSFFAEEYDPDEFIQIHDGVIEFDQNGLAAELKENVIRYIDSIPMKSKDELNQEVEWCQKMLLRAKRNDAEGLFRWHWLLMETLEIYFDIVGKRYFGPKKGLIWMKENDSESYQIYEMALRSFDYEKLSDWIGHLKEIL